MTKVSQLLSAIRRESDMVVTVSPKTSILNAALIMKLNNIGALPVIDEGVVIGIITERDMAFKIVVDEIYAAEAIVADHMTKFPEYVTPHTDINDCLALMEEKGFRHVLVLDKGRLVGIVSIRDVLVVMLRNQQLLSQQFESFIRGGA